MRTQTLIWTALPNGHPLNVDGEPDPTHLAISVFMSPRLTTNEGGAEPTLSPYFPDFVNWPATISNVRFTVTVGGAAPIPAVWRNVYNRIPLPLDPTRWPLVFGPTNTGIRPYKPTNYSTLKTHTFDAHGAYNAIEAIYQSFGINNPTVPPIMTGNSKGILGLPSGSPVAPAVQQIEDTRSDRATNPIGSVAKYYIRPGPTQPDVTPWVPSLQTLDFHEAISALGSYPVLLRLFGLVFDLTIPLPANFTSGQSTISVTPTWTSSFTGTNGRKTVNVTPTTACMLVPSPVPPNVDLFLPVPQLNAEDYRNGMLDLTDSSRFSVTELDVDGGSQQVSALAQVLQTLSQYQASIGSLAAKQSVAVSLPALRSTGPSVVRSGWAAQLQSLTARQQGYQTVLNNYLSGASNQLPTFFAEDVIRGHRFDVYTVSEAVPTWRSLNLRAGAYSFGPSAGPNPPSASLPLSATDEGLVTPGASQVAGIPNPPQDLYIHEEIARWGGWSLSAPRVGGRIDTDDSPQTEAGNPAAPTSIPGQAPDLEGNVTPQMSATFTVPAGTLPKLRFGSQYQLRARSVDLAGNSIAPTTRDASTATPAFTHYRYQPVPPPVVAPTLELTPGQGVMLAALLNYSDGSPITSIGRWLFPPRTSQLLAEEHGMFDGFSLGSPPDPADGLDGSQNTWDYISQYDAGTLTNTPGVAIDPVNSTPYFPTDPANPFAAPPVTSWIPDPLSGGAAFSGLPGTVPGSHLFVDWGTGPWPTLEPMAVILQAGVTPGYLVNQNDGNYPLSAVVASLPPAAVFNVHISSALTDPSTLGVWQWILAGLPSTTQQQAFLKNALAGQLWMLSPYHTLRMVHAVRLPIFGPFFGGPEVVPRPYGSTTANIYDIKFFVDEPSTSTVDVVATWSDPIDNPGDPNNDPDRDQVVTTGHAFKLAVPDPNPPAAADEPGLVVPAPETFALFSAPGTTHDIGDTKYHSVSYQATGTSRFSEFFRSYPPIPITVTKAPIALSTTYGLDPGSLQAVDINGNDVPDTEYTVDPVGGTVTFDATSAYQGQALTLSWIPTITETGSATTVTILASARPKPPQIVRVSPAWQITGPTGTVDPGIGYRRQGGYLRVYLDRPWWTSGANELLGVVTLPRQFGSASPPPDPQLRLGTLMGLDPITLGDPRLHFLTTPQYIEGTTTLPKTVPGRNGYNVPATLPLLEDPANHYNGYPFEVDFDYTTNQWYADIQLKFFTPDVPPPGYFVRLALVRFQPYAYPGAELSPVALATFAQPVADRAVAVAQVGTTQRMRVAVQGPGYQGFRPASADSGGQTVVYDRQNVYAPGPYTNFPPDPKVTSTMVVDVQVQNVELGLPGELAWQQYTAIPPVELQPVFNGGIVTWEGYTDMPFPISATGTPQRLRISEIDFYQGIAAPAQIDTTLRRPFVCHIPVI